MTKGELLHLAAYISVHGLVEPGDGRLVFKWQGIAQEIGLSERTVQRRCSEAGIVLPKWGGGGTSPVYLPLSLVLPLARLIGCAGS